MIETNRKVPRVHVVPTRALGVSGAIQPGEQRDGAMFYSCFPSAIMGIDSCV
jgi:hypothetical protein